MPLDAAPIAVPFPLRTPEMLVVRVSEGVAPPDDEPAKPLAEATDTAVTVPVVPVMVIGELPMIVKDVQVEPPEQDAVVVGVE